MDSALNPSLKVEDSSIVVPIDSFQSDAATINYWIQALCNPIIVAVGLVGNSLAIKFIRNTEFRQLPSCCFLHFLAVADIGFLLSILWLWFELMLQRNTLGEVDWVCKFLTYYNQVCDFSSVWLIVCLVVERTMVLFQPDFRRYFNYSCALKISWTVIIISAIYSSWTLVLATSIEVDIENRTYRFCNSNPAYASIQKALNTFDTFASCIVPSAIILFLNGLIARELYTYGSRPIVHVLLRAFKNSTAGSIGRKVMNQFSLTRGLLYVTTIYILLNLPSYIFRLFQVYEIINMNMSGFLETQIALYQLYYLHHALNFYLFTFFSPTMKRQLSGLCQGIIIYFMSCECFNIGGCLDIDAHRYQYDTVQL